MHVFEGTVVHGKGMGAGLGFPTANLRVSDPPTVANGVYAGQVYVDGKPYAAVINIGNHPTLPEGKPTIEAHLLGWSGDLYGERVSVRLLRYLREERTFGSIDALRAQIARDVASARGAI